MISFVGVNSRTFTLERWFFFFSFTMDIQLSSENNEFVDGVNRGYLPYFPSAMMPTAPTPSYVVLPQRPSPTEDSVCEAGPKSYAGLSSVSMSSPVGLSSISMSSPDNSSMPSPISATSFNLSSSPSSSQASSDAGGGDVSAANKRKGECHPIHSVKLKWRV